MSPALAPACSTPDAMTNRLAKHPRDRQQPHRVARCLAAIVVGLIIGIGPVHSASAQGRPAAADDAAENPQRRAAIRFLTDGDHPPFNYLDEDGTLTGLNVDLAKALCLELAATCDIQAKPWAELLPAIRRGETDAVVASHVATPGLMGDVALSDRYYATPARFVALKGSVFTDITPTGLAQRKIAVAKATAHEAYLKAFFRLSDIQLYENVELARDAVRNKTADLLFDDGIGLVFWLNGEASKLCCEFKGGPFTEPNYFGDGIGILLRRDDALLRTQVNGALKRLRDSGRIEELMLRYFPIRPY
jgi:polar amino acid transport system substrate-binding protein